MLDTRTTVLGRSILGTAFPQNASRAATGAGRIQRELGGVPGAWAQAAGQGLSAYIMGLPYDNQLLRALQQMSSTLGTDSDFFRPGDTQQLMLDRMGEGPAPAPSALLEELVVCGVDDLVENVRGMGQDRTATVNSNQAAIKRRELLMEAARAELADVVAERDNLHGQNALLQAEAGDVKALRDELVSLSDELAQVRAELAAADEQLAAKSSGRTGGRR